MKSSCLQRPATLVFKTHDLIDLFVLFVSRVVCQVTGRLKPWALKPKPHLVGIKKKERRKTEIIGPPPVAIISPLAAIGITWSASNVLLWHQRICSLSSWSVGALVAFNPLHCWHAARTFIRFDVCHTEFLRCSRRDPCRSWFISYFGLNWFKDLCCDTVAQWWELRQEARGFDSGPEAFR